MVVSVLLKIKFTQINLSEISMPRIGIPISKTACINPCLLMHGRSGKRLCIFECCHEIQDRRRQILCVPVHNRIKEKRNLQPTNEDGITIKLLMKNFEAYCFPKKNLVIER